MAKGLSRKCRFPYDEDYYPSSFGLEGFEPTLTKQSDAPAADINTIVKRWMNDGVLPQNLNKGLAQFVDVSEVPDYRGCLDLVIQAQQTFNELPSAVRERFQNDPAAFLDFVHNPANIDEMVRLGLASKREEPSTRAASAPQNASDAAPVGGSAVAPAGASTASTAPVGA